MAALGSFSLLGIIVFIVMLIISAIRKRPKKVSLIGLAACVVIFGVAMASTDDVATALEEKTFEEEFAEKHDISIDAANSIFVACEQIGIPREQITNFEQVDDWVEGKSYEFGYSGVEVNAYLNKDFEVRLLKSGNVDLYKNGDVIFDINDKILTSEREVQLRIWAEDRVSSVLKAPSTAKFPNEWGFARDKDIYAVSGCVDAQNSFGAMIRSEFYLEYNWPQGSDTATLTKFVFDGESII